MPEFTSPGCAQFSAFAHTFLVQKCQTQGFKTVVHKPTDDIIVEMSI